MRFEVSLVRHQIEFPKSHGIRGLLDLVATIHPKSAEDLRDADFLTPFGVKLRYPGDFPEILPGGDNRAIELAGKVRKTVMALLESYFSQRS